MTVVVPNLEHALVFEWNGDNAGPPTVDDMVSTFAAVAKEFPGAQVVASTFDNFTQHLMVRHVKPRALPFLNLIYVARGFCRLLPTHCLLFLLRLATRGCTVRPVTLTKSKKCAR